MSIALRNFIVASNSIQKRQYLNHVRFKNDDKESDNVVWEGKIANYFVLDENVYFKFQEVFSIRVISFIGFIEVRVI